MADSTLSTSRSAATSSAQSANRNRFRDRRPRPCPRRSGASTRKCFAERFEHLEPVEPARRKQAMQEHDGRRARRAGNVAHERRAPARELHSMAKRNRRATDGGLQVDVCHRATI